MVRQKSLKQPNPKNFDMGKVNDYLPHEMQGQTLENAMRFGFSPKHSYHAAYILNISKQQERITDTQARLRRKLINRYTTSENDK